MEVTPVHAREAQRRLDSVCGALQPYGWHRLTPEMLVRRVVGAADRAGRSDQPVTAEAVPRDDPRVEPLVRYLGGTAWRALTVGELCRRLLEALDHWELRDRCLDLEIAWLLDEGA
jgi:hypothetical protein